MIIINNIYQFHRSKYSTCFPFVSGSSAIDYALANLPFIFYIINFNIFNTPPLFYHTYITLNFPLTTCLPFHIPSLFPTTPHIHFHHNLNNIYIKYLNKHLSILHLIQDPILKEYLFSKYLWTTTRKLIPHTINKSSPPHYGHCPITNSLIMNARLCINLPTLLFNTILILPNKRKYFIIISLDIERGNIPLQKY